MSKRGKSSKFKSRGKKTKIKSQYNIELKEALRFNPTQGKIKGVYKITNIDNGNFYIGSSNHIYRRYHVHLLGLRFKQHTNWKLQEDYDKYGAGKFKLDVLEKAVGVSRTEIYHMEQKWMDDLKPYYNIQLIVEIPNKPRAVPKPPKGSKVRRLPCVEPELRSYKPKNVKKYTPKRKKWQIHKSVPTALQRAKMEKKNSELHPESKRINEFIERSREFRKNQNK